MLPRKVAFISSKKHVTWIWRNNSSIFPQMPKQQSKQHLHPKINVPQSLWAISDIDKCKCTINDMVRDSCTTDNKWRQSIALSWYDCPIRTKIMTLATLLRHNIRHDDNHQRKKVMNAQSMLRWWRHMFYKNPSRSMKKVCTHIAIQKVGFILTKFWLKLRRGVPRPPIQTSFCAGKQSV